MTDEECEFVDSIYLPSKCSISSVLPYYELDLEICNKSILIAIQHSVFYFSSLLFVSSSLYQNRYSRVYNIRGF